MKQRWIALTLCALFAVALIATQAEAGPYNRLICPIGGGTFVLADGQLWFDITKEDGKPVEKYREKVANPLDEKSHDALVKRGAVTVEVHAAEGGGLFVHWGTLKDDK